MAPKAKPFCRTTKGRRLVVYKKGFQEALAKYRAECVGTERSVAKMIWSVLQTDEKKELLQLGQTDIGTPESQQALVAQDLAVQIGAESAADPLRKALVASGRRVLKDKEKVQL